MQKEEVTCSCKFCPNFIRFASKEAYFFLENC